MSISLCVITRNEEYFLPGLLESAGPYVDELVVVDTGSSDDTVGIAKRLGAKVFEFHVDALDEARNLCHDVAHGDWILSLDADERMIEPELASLSSLTRDPDAVAYSAEIYNYTGRGLWSNYRVWRLYRRHQAIRWEGQFHETLIYSLNRLGATRLESGLSIHHLEILGIDRSLQKRKRNIAAIETYLRQSGADPRLRSFLALDYYALGDVDRALHELSLVVSDSPSEINALRFTADVHLALGKLDVARRWYGEALTLTNGRDERSRLGLCFADYLDHEPELALERIRELSQQSVKPHFLINRAIMLHGMGDFLGSQALFSAAVESSPILRDPRIYEQGHRFSLYRLQCSLIAGYAPIEGYPEMIWRAASFRS